MIDLVKDNLWKQFGAAIDMLENSIRAWPSSDWESDSRCFYHAYHTIVFLDYYLNFPAVEGNATLPYTLIDWAKRPQGQIDDVMPDRFYSRDEVLSYLGECRDKCHRVISSLTEDRVKTLRWQLEGRDFPVVEMLLYNMRHVQHHAAQLNLILREKINEAPDWVSRAR